MHRPAVVVFLSALLAPLLMVSADELKLKYPLGLKKMRIPRSNGLTEEKVALGKQLYFDARLSIDNTISCASCHHPDYGWTDGKAFSTGVRDQLTGRSAPTIVNSGYQYFQFWDGRAKQLEGQALGPIQSPVEMDMKLDVLVDKLNKIEGYREQFQAVFATDVTSEGIAKAIAAFERTVLSGDAPYDRFKAGNEKALSASARRGMELFFSGNRANCTACHQGHNFTDGAFHNIGVSMDKKEPDVGRFAVTKLEGDRGTFKTPTLREIGRTAPYMHDGSLKTLEEVVEFYAKGGVKNPQLDEEIHPLKLSKQDKADLVTFMKEGLSSASYPDFKEPKLPK